MSEHQSNELRTQNVIVSNNNNDDEKAKGDASLEGVQIAATADDVVVMEQGE
jgi:hypothetical protein